MMRNYGSSSVPVFRVDVEQVGETRELIRERMREQQPRVAEALEREYKREQKELPMKSREMDEMTGRIKVDEVEPVPVHHRREQRHREMAQEKARKYAGAHEGRMAPTDFEAATRPSPESISEGTAPRPKHERVGELAHKEQQVYYSLGDARGTSGWCFTAFVVPEYGMSDLQVRTTFCSFRICFGRT